MQVKMFEKDMLAPLVSEVFKQGRVQPGPLATVSILNPRSAKATLKLKTQSLEWAEALMQPRSFRLEVDRLRIVGGPHWDGEEPSLLAVQYPTVARML